jgi:hypothetical protein
MVFLLPLVSLGQSLPKASQGHSEVEELCRETEILRRGSPMSFKCKLIPHLRLNNSDRTC